MKQTSNNIGIYHYNTKAPQCLTSWRATADYIGNRERMIDGRATRALRYVIQARREDERLFAKFLNELYGIRAINPNDKSEILRYIDEELSESPMYKRFILLAEGQIISLGRSVYSSTAKRIGLDELSDRAVQAETAKFVRQSFDYYSIGTKKQMRKVLGILEIGDYPNREDLVNDILKKFREKDYLAHTAVRTAANSVSGQVDLAAYIRSPDITYIRWITAGDSRVRPSHRRNGLVNFGVQKKGLPFPNGNTWAGADYNCRCVTVELSDEEALQYVSEFQKTAISNPELLTATDQTLASIFGQAIYGNYTYAAGRGL